MRQNLKFMEWWGRVVRLYQNGWRIGEESFIPTPQMVETFKNDLQSMRIYKTYFDLGEEPRLLD